MKRREALKNIGMAMGYATVIPSAFSILQSCNTEEKNWTPVFFSEEEGIVVKNLVELILPKTKNSPGALEVNVPEFIDLFAQKALPPEETIEYRAGIDSIMDELPIPETGAKDLVEEDYHKLLKKYLKANEEKRKQYELNENITYMALASLRGQAIWAFKTSEEIGENVLAYDPIPGIQKGCISLQKATGGKDWSL